ncbi:MULTISPECIES: BCCT family transporter [unclassified Colwellia]|jgi:choline-glycine betaine transporter|uniref:BCCT family transporter n=1 Tax=unclassified Colwellia TaxID=196834 RepID=UPI0015F554A8|nr:MULTISPECIES: BCCT family transporter [unclassified Colwellia]MBA6363123.1 BCCT family transporter [Colwellia sp. BRX8-8]MBA6337398.1 BCCT family transporter [Colwellia sp. BRX8-7]MBA6346615.1 BCCT family transporter [Colwellia sp. BRX8-9]MBA6353676.1 BCCT family transporter [Colwellia sp. BRX9-1]MBA6357148.1 BCCT family transporter [Colwellia sp. BRX8-3]|tara:strand:+ start:1650 stop:2867 length:1218 start_codon:yes stop_codon:yes gene_type:complete
MTTWLSAGLIFTFTAIAFVLYRWGNIRCVGVTPVKTFTFIAILFTSGLDVGLIMFPLTEFAGYADLATNPEYGFTNPLAIEFGYWAFLIWGFYFLTCFYFCVIEPRVRFFEIPLVKLVNNVVIIGTCAFTAYLLLTNLPWYMPELGDGESIVSSFYLIVFLVIAAAVYSSTNIRYVKILSLATTWLFLALIGLMWGGAFLSETSSIGEFANTIAMIGGYFGNIHEFALPLNDYHEFYLYWWFAWSIMIGQFTSRFVGGLRTYQVLAAMLVFPSIPIAIWFSVLYYYSANGLETAGFYNIAMAFVGITFVINSLDSLIRLYTDNLNLSVARLGRVKYFFGNLIALSLLTLLFKLDFLQIQWVGAVVIGLFFTCFGYILFNKFKAVSEIERSPKENKIDFTKIELVE